MSAQSLRLQVFQSGPDTSSCSAFCCIILLLAHFLFYLLTANTVFRASSNTSPPTTVCLDEINLFTRPLKDKNVYPLQNRNRQKRTQSEFVRWAIICANKGGVVA